MFKTEDLSEVLAFATFASHDVVPSREDASIVREAMINGRLTRTDYPASVPHALICTLSTISALSKELDLDLAAEGKALSMDTESGVKSVASAFGQYVHTPVMMFESLLRRLLYVSWQRAGSFTIQSLLTKFLNVMGGNRDGYHSMLITAMHLWFAIYSAKLYDSGLHSMPFELQLNKRGKFYMIYRYSTNKGRRRVIRWDLGLKLPSNPNIAFLQGLQQ